MADCACSIDDIEKLCGEGNAPGLQPVLSITCLDEVNTIPAPETGTHEIADNITMRTASAGPPAVTAGRFRKWNFEAKDASFSCEKDDNGLWNSEVKIFIPKLKKETTHTLAGLYGDNHIALVEDMNEGGLRLLGNLKNGCMVKVKETTTPKNGYEVTLTWQSATAPYWYTGTVTY